MNTRLKEARKALNMNQKEFGARLGVTNSAIALLEKGERNFTDQMVFSICREHGISEKWLRTGEGEMFSDKENALITQLSEQYNLNNVDKKMIETYVSLPKEQRAALKAYVKRLARSIQTEESEFSDDLTFAADTIEEAESESLTKWAKGMTREEYIAAAAKRYDDKKRGAALSSISAKVGNE